MRFSAKARPGKQPPAAVAALVIGLLATCGGIAVIDPSPSGAAGSGGEHTAVGGSAATGGSNAGGGGGGGGGVGGEGGTSGWAGSGPGPCMSCLEWIEDCGDFGLCQDPSEACAGVSSVQVEGMVQCVCAGCMDVCGGSCVMFLPEQPTCHECQVDLLLSGCYYEYLSCTEPL